MYTRNEPFPTPGELPTRRAVLERLRSLAADLEGRGELSSPDATILRAVREILAEHERRL